MPKRHNSAQLIFAHEMTRSACFQVNVADTQKCYIEKNCILNRYNIPAFIPITFYTIVSFTVWFTAVRWKKLFLPTIFQLYHCGLEKIESEVDCVSNDPQPLKWHTIRWYQVKQGDTRWCHQGYPLLQLVILDYQVSLWQICIQPWPTCLSLNDLLTFLCILCFTIMNGLLFFFCLLVVLASGFIFSLPWAYFPRSSRPA